MKASYIKSNIFKLSRASSMALTSMVCITLSACGGGGATNTDAEAADTSRAQALGTSITPQATVTWKRVAEQDQYFQAAKPIVVRFGYGSLWTQTKLTGNYRCVTSTFGVDPAPGVQKVCESKSGTWLPGVATLSWTPSADNAVSGYRVYLGISANTYLQTPGSGFYAADQSGFTVTGLPAGNTYHFAVTSIDAAGNESTYSNEVTKLVQ